MIDNLVRFPAWICPYCAERFGSEQSVPEHLTQKCEGWGVCVVHGFVARRDAAEHAPCVPRGVCMPENP